MYDATVVGARVVGSPTAMLLARGGHKVLLLDRDTFPSDIMSTHFITQTGVESLQRWGLLDAARNSNCPPITRISQDFGGLALSGEPPLPDGIDGAYCPRRVTALRISGWMSGSDLSALFSRSATSYRSGRGAGPTGAGATRDGTGMGAPPMTGTTKIAPTLPFALPACGSAT